jgi:hypothetical protein
MGKVKTEVQALVTKLKSKNAAVADTKRWFTSARNSSGDSSVRRDNGVFKPGKIYVFRYEKPIKDKMWDRNPVVLSLGRVGGYDVGINLNHLDYNKRLDLLDRVYSQFEKSIERSIKTSGGDALSQNIITSMQYENIQRFIESSGYLKAFRRYITNKRTHSTIVGYTQWNRIALLDIIDIQGGDVNKAYDKTNK